MKQLFTLTILSLSMILNVREILGVKLITFDVDKFRLDSSLISEIRDTADCENFLELIPEIGCQFGDVILGPNIIIRPHNVSNRRVMVCLSGPQVDQAYIKSIRILDNSNTEEKVYIYTRQSNTIESDKHLN